MFVKIRHTFYLIAFLPMLIVGQSQQISHFLLQWTEDCTSPSLHIYPISTSKGIQENALIMLGSPLNEWL